VTGEARRRLAALAVAGALVAAAAPTLVEVGEAVAEEEMFLGVVVRGVDRGAVFVRRRGEVWLAPLEETLGLLGAELRDDGDGPRIATPIGARTLPADAIEEIDGVAHLRTDFLSEALATPVRFSEALYALDVDTPWTPGDPVRDSAPLDRDAAAPTPEPDARPPAAGLSRIFGEIGAGYATDGEGLEAAAVDLRLAGPAGGGLWQVRLEQALEPDMRFADPVVSDYIWVRPLAETLWVQLGNQRLTVGPLVGGAEVTGAQLAWSNRPEAFAFTGVSPGALLSGFGSGTRTFTGVGPPGGRAELWISGRPVAQAAIGIDGRYEIEDAPLFGLQSDVEIRIYRRRGDAAPVEIREQTVTRGARFQPKGALMALGGVGREGNPADPDDARDAGVVFGRAMGAPFAWLTLGASGLAFDDGHAVGGLDALVELGPFASASGSVAGDETGVGAYEAGLTAQFGPVFLDVSAFEVAEGFRDRIEEDEEDEEDPFVEDAFALLAPETLDRRATVGATFWDRRVQVGIEGRQTEFAEYVLPFGRVAPLPRLTLSAAPDAMGEYRWEAAWTDRGGVSARALRVSKTTALRLDRPVAGGFVGDGAVFGDAVMDDDGDWRLTAGLAGDRLGGFDVDWRMEGGAEDASPIGWTSFGRTLAPGVRGYLELAGRQEAVWGFAGLSLDLGLVDGRLAAGEAAPLDLRTGAVDTVLVGPDGAPMAFGPGERPEIRVDGAGPRWGTAEGEGEVVRFRSDRVARGLRRVEVDPGDLPIELSPARRVWHVAVSPATTTVLEVPLVLRLGLSGLLTTGSGAPAAERRVEILDAAGEVAASTVSNRFGQFRADGLAPGRYVARAEGIEAAFALTDDFLFGLALTGLREGEAPATPAPEPTTPLTASASPGPLPLGQDTAPRAIETAEAASAPHRVGPQSAAARLETAAPAAGSPSEAIEALPSAPGGRPASDTKVPNWRAAAERVRDAVAQALAPADAAAAALRRRLDDALGPRAGDEAPAGRPPRPRLHASALPGPPRAAWRQAPGDAASAGARPPDGSETEVAAEASRTPTAAPTLRAPRIAPRPPRRTEALARGGPGRDGRLAAATEPDATG